MRNKLEEYQFIKGDDKYRQYIKSLPPFTQIRYIAKTSLNGSMGVITPVQHKTKNYTLVVPYYIVNSYIKDIEEYLVDGGPEQTVEDIARLAIKRETCYRVSAMDIMEDVIERKNSLRDSKVPHIKRVAVVTDYIFNEQLETAQRSIKTGKPVWMHNSLLPEIFGVPMFKNGERKDHPQKRAYYLHNKWLRERSTIKNVLQRFIAQWTGG